MAGMGALDSPSSLAQLTEGLPLRVGTCPAGQMCPTSPPLGGPPPLLGTRLTEGRKSVWLRASPKPSPCPGPTQGPPKTSPRHFDEA